MGVLQRIEKRKLKKIKKAIKNYRKRFWKNLAIFMAGVFCSGFIFAGVVAAVLAFVPISTLTGDNTDKIVSEELADESILNVLLGIKDYTTDDIIAVNTLIDAIQNAEVGGKQLKEYVTIDTNKLAGVKILELGNVIKDAIKVTATIENTVGTAMLDEIGIGSITALTDYEKVFAEDGVTPETIGTMDTSAQSFKAKMYYYLVKEAVGEEPAVFERAYNDDGTPVEGVTAETELYYGALTKMPITDAVLLVNDVPGRIKAKDLLTVFGTGTEGIIGNILGDKTVAELGDLNADSIYIYDILGGESDSDIYNLLSDATGKPYNEILASDLTGLDLQEVKISTVLNTTYPTGYMIDGVEQTGSLIADILIDTQSWDEEEYPNVNAKWDSLSINAISGINSNSIKLKTVLNTTYPTGYMKDGVEQTGSLVADLLIDSKEWDASFDNVNKKWDSLSVSDISGINSSSIKLKTVLSTTYPTGYVKTDETIVENGSTMANILIESKTFDTSTDEGEAEKTKWDAMSTNEKWDSLTVNDISNIDFNNIKLSTLGITAGGNNILAALLSDDDVTVANIGTKINQLKLYDVFGKECFKIRGTEGATFVDETTHFALEEIDTDDDGINDHLAFVHEDEQYFIENPEADQYGLCANDGMWLLLCFDAKEVNEVTGKPGSYVISDLSFNTLTEDPSEVSSRFENATIAQLVDAGLLQGVNPLLYPLTLTTALSHVSIPTND